MKKIRTTNQVAGPIFIGKWTFSRNLKEYTVDMVNNVTVQKFLNRNLLELVDDEIQEQPKQVIQSNTESLLNKPEKDDNSVSSSKESKKDEDIVISNVKTNQTVTKSLDETIQVSDVNKELVVSSTVNQIEEVKQDPFIPPVTVDNVSQEVQNDKFQVVTSDPNDPKMKVIMDIDESLEYDLKKLNDDLEKIAKKEEIIVPEKKN